MAPERELLSSAVKPIPVVPIAAALRTDLKVKALAEVHSSLVPNQPGPGALVA
jgi:hypothetical protein